MINGVYAVLASATTGVSYGVIDIRDGQFQGNDIAGAKYAGTATRKTDGSVDIDVSMTTPPGVFHIWRGQVGQTFETVEIKVTLPKESFDEGKPYELNSYGMWVIFQRIPADYAPFAGPDGPRILIDNLVQSERHWANYQS